jgi:hypothetical protein
MYTCFALFSTVGMHIEWKQLHRQRTSNEHDNNYSGHGQDTNHKIDGWKIHI